jgi:hypothetical protein
MGPDSLWTRVEVLIYPGNHDAGLAVEAQSVGKFAVRHLDTLTPLKAEDRIVEVWDEINVYLERLDEQEVQTAWSKIG